MPAKTVESTIFSEGVLGIPVQVLQGGIEQRRRRLGASGGLARELREANAPARLQNVEANAGGVGYARGEADAVEVELGDNDPGVTQGFDLPAVSVDQQARSLTESETIALLLLRAGDE